MHWPSTSQTVVASARQKVWKRKSSWRSQPTKIYPSTTSRSQFLSQSTKKQWLNLWYLLLIRTFLSLFHFPFPHQPLRTKNLWLIQQDEVGNYSIWSSSLLFFLYRHFSIFLGLFLSLQCLQSKKLVKTIDRTKIYVYSQ